MKSGTQLLLTALAVFSLQLIQLPAGIAQRSTLVQGNGEIQTKQYSLTSFTRLLIAFPAEVEIDAQSTDPLKITADANILEKIRIETAGETLRIISDGWIEPSQPVRIRLGAPGLTQVETGGYGTYYIRNVVAPSFSLVNPVGNVTLTGKTEHLTVETTTGMVDASGLTAAEATVRIESWGVATVSATDLLDAVILGDGQVIYTGEPREIRKQLRESGQVVSAVQAEREPASTAPEYVTFKLYNSKLARIGVLIQGPEAHRFQYGADIGALQKRKETLPVGTKIYRLSKTEEKELLLTVEAGFAGRTVNLID